MKQITQKNQLLRTRDLEKAFGVTKTTLYFWRKRGLPYIRLTQRSIRYDPKAVADWIERTNKPADK